LSVFDKNPSLLRNSCEIRFRNNPPPKAALLAGVEDLLVCWFGFDVGLGFLSGSIGVLIQYVLQSD